MKEESAKPTPIQFPQMAFDIQISKVTTGTCSHCLDSMFKKEEVWVPRNSFCEEIDYSVCKPSFVRSRLSNVKKPSTPEVEPNTDDKKRNVCKKLNALRDRKRAIVEWQTIAKVIDRILFWIFLICTLTAYVVILIYFPYTKPKI